jgi:PAS domain S-box-containing protein
MSDSQNVFFQSILNSNLSPVFSVDRNYCYINFNTTHASVMKSLYGVDIKVGMNLLQCMTIQDDREKAKLNIDRTFNGEEVNEEAYSGNDDKTRLYFQVTHYPVRNNNVIVGATIIAKDITQKKQAEDLIMIQKKEMEKMNKLMIDRELTMIELKKKIDQLEKNKITSL